MIKSIGKLVYSPKSHLGDPSKWLVVYADDDICKYYAYLFHKEYPWLGKFCRPLFGAHISTIRGEKISNSNLWGLDNNKIIEFEYEPGPLNNDQYYYLKVKCDYLCDLRENYGLSRNPQFGLHLTIGRLTND